MNESESERKPLTVNQAVNKINETVETLPPPVTTPALIKALSEDENLSVLDKMEVALFMGYQLQGQVEPDIILQ